MRSKIEKTYRFEKKSHGGYELRARKSPTDNVVNLCGFDVRSMFEVPFNTQAVTFVVSTEEPTDDDEYYVMKKKYEGMDVPQWTFRWVTDTGPQLMWAAREVLHEDFPKRANLYVWMEK